MSAIACTFSRSAAAWSGVVVNVRASPVAVSAAETLVPGTLIGHMPAIPPTIGAPEDGPGATAGWLVAAGAARPACMQAVLVKARTTGTRSARVMAALSFAWREAESAR